MNTDNPAINALIDTVLEGKDRRTLMSGGVCLVDTAEAILGLEVILKEREKTTQGIRMAIALSRVIAGTGSKIIEEEK